MIEHIARRSERLIEGFYLSDDQSIGKDIKTSHTGLYGVKTTCLAGEGGVRMKVTCNDGCKREFLVGEVKTKNVKADIEKTYFICPRCGKEYTVLLTDSKIRQDQQRLEILEKEQIALREKIVKDMSLLSQSLEGQMG
ncbi:hypothetical protein [Paenibacillus larvae]|uniref:hypothetical protein n=1 Tax=Paenibacillus larvae TaxID=1464 RepID=UPI000A9AA109|nr:hypothetical protein [Paenibacillus larvae]